MLLVAAQHRPARLPQVLVNVEVAHKERLNALKADVHVLVIPRAHFANIAEVAAADPATAAAMLTTAADVAAAEGVAGSGYRLIANTGAGGGQTVFHAHLHLLAGARLPGF